MTWFNWIYSTQHIKKNSFCTWGCCQWPFVDPTVICIHCCHQLSEWNILWNRIKVIFQLKWIKKLIYQFYLFLCDTSIEILCIKNNTNSRCYYIFLNMLWKMDNMHFKIKSLSINCMLRLWMKVKLICIKFICRCDILWDLCIFWFEFLMFLFCIFVFYKYFNCVFSIPLNFCFFNILVIFLKFIFNINCWKRITVHMIS